MMASTLSPGLNKSDEFIKKNTIDLHTRHIEFFNNTKVHLNEDTRVPAAKLPIRHYICCGALGYFNDYRECQDTLQFEIRCNVNLFPQTTASITPAD